MTEIPCAINPAKICECSQIAFATEMFEEIVAGLQEKYGMTKEDAVAEYRKGDPVRRSMAVSNEVNRACKFSPLTAHFRVKNGQIED